MTIKVINVNSESNIPLFGVDFIGIIDRGTNIIEIKPLTLCNLNCKYCFVSAGDYDTNFIVDPDFLIEKVRETISIKGNHDIEIHIAPYGESLLYPQISKLIKTLWTIKGVNIISMQSNGLLLTREIIERLEEVNLTRINISLNTLNKARAEYLCACKDYNMNALLDSISLLLESKIDVLLAPVWFPSVNDDDIEDIIKFVVDLRNKGYTTQKIQIGIQKYLIYKTGRKLKKIHTKTWDYFYKQLAALERKYNIKLKLGPNDFGIHKRANIAIHHLKKKDKISLTVVSKGRWNRELIGKITENFGIKVLLTKPFTYSKDIIGKEIEARIIKANYRDNIITALFPS